MRLPPSSSWLRPDTALRHAWQRPRWVAGPAGCSQAGCAQPTGPAGGEAAKVAAERSPTGGALIRRASHPGRCGSSLTLLSDNTGLHADICLGPGRCWLGSQPPEPPAATTPPQLLQGGSPTCTHLQAYILTGVTMVLGADPGAEMDEARLLDLLRKAAAVAAAGALHHKGFQCFVSRRRLRHHGCYCCCCCCCCCTPLHPRSPSTPQPSAPPPPPPPPPLLPLLQVPASRLLAGACRQTTPAGPWCASLQPKCATLPPSVGAGRPAAVHGPGPAAWGGRPQVPA